MLSLLLGREGPRIIVLLLILPAIIVVSAILLLCAAPLLLVHLLRLRRSMVLSVLTTMVGVPAAELLLVLEAGGTTSKVGLLMLVRIHWHARSARMRVRAGLTAEATSHLPH